MELLPIKETAGGNAVFINNPLCQDTIYLSIGFYQKVGFAPPWICYYVMQNGELVGSAAFKGRPVNGSVEIAYGTFENFRKRGFGTKICRQLVELALKTDPTLRITARTLPENNFSVRVLEKNNFTCVGIVMDPEDGPVWEWEYEANR